MRTSDDRISELSDMLLAEGELSETEATELREALGNSATAREIYLRRCELHLALGEFAEFGIFSNLVSASGELPLPTAIQKGYTEPEPAPARESRPPKKRPVVDPDWRYSKPEFWKGIAALLVVGTGLIWILNRLEQEPMAVLPSVEKTDEPERIAISPRVPAPDGPSQPSPETGEQLVASPGPTIDKVVEFEKNSVVEPLPEQATKIPTDPLPQTERLVGPAIGVLVAEGGTWDPLGDFNAGYHKVESGATLEARLDSGVRLKVVGPSSFTIEPSGMELSLETGKMSAEVFPSASGFKVLANGTSFVDHGTRFAVAANMTGISAAHVYDGEVSVNPPGQPAVDLSTGESLQVNGTQVKRIDFEPKLFAPKPVWTGGIEWYSKTISILTEAPRNLRDSDLPDDQPVILEEQKRISTNRTIVVNQFQDGRLTVNSEKLKVPNGVKLSSYLVQYKNSGSWDRCNGKVRFDGPVIGIIANSDLLDDTDRQFGLKRTNYPTGYKRGAIKEFGLISSKLGEPEWLLEWRAKGNDSIILLQDGRTIQFDLTTNTLDHFRILVAAD